MRRARWYKRSYFTQARGTSRDDRKLLHVTVSAVRRLGSAHSDTHGFQATHSSLAAALPMIVQSVHLLSCHRLSRWVLWFESQHSSLTCMFTRRRTHTEEPYWADQGSASKFSTSSGLSKPITPATRIAFKPSVARSPQTITLPTRRTVRRTHLRVPTLAHHRDAMKTTCLRGSSRWCHGVTRWLQCIECSVPIDISQHNRVHDPTEQCKGNCAPSRRPGY